mgnify:CR=1 FL=1
MNTAMIQKIWAGITLSLLMLSIANAQPVKDTEITFKIKNAGLTVNGSLQGFEGNIDFNPNDLQSSKITASVQVETIDTGIGMRDKHLKKDDYFDVEKYPKITMVSKSFTTKNDGSYEGIFDLTIKGHTEEITLPFSISDNSGTRTFSANFELDRRDYGVGGNSFLLSDKVEAFIKVETELPQAGR